MLKKFFGGGSDDDLLFGDFEHTPHWEVSFKGFRVLAPTDREGMELIPIGDARKLAVPAGCAAFLNMAFHGIRYGNPAHRLSYEFRQWQLIRTSAGQAELAPEPMCLRKAHDNESIDLETGIFDNRIQVKVRSPFKTRWFYKVDAVFLRGG